MLITLTFYQHFTNEKTEEFMFDDVDERRKRRRKTKTKTKDENEDERRKRRSKKNSRKKKVNFQNKCVSSRNHRNKKRRGRHRSGYTYLLRGEIVRAGLARAERAAILHGDIQLYRKPP